MHNRVHYYCHSFAERGGNRESGVVEGEDDRHRLHRLCRYHSNTRPLYGTLLGSEVRTQKCIGLHYYL